MEQNKIDEQLLQDLMKQFLSYAVEVDGLADVMQNIGLLGWCDENDDWQEPEWKLEALKVLAMAREKLQKLHQIALKYEKDEECQKKNVKTTYFA